jgi:hypothetical protein
MKEEFGHCCRVIIIRKWLKEFSKDEGCETSVTWWPGSQGGNSSMYHGVAVKDAFEQQSMITHYKQGWMNAEVTHLLTTSIVLG